MPRGTKTKVLYILPALAAGGAEKFILDLIINLDQTKYQPAILLFKAKGFLIDLAIERGIEIIQLAKTRKIEPINFIKIIRAIKKFKADIVHTELGGDIYGRLAAWICGVKVIISTEQNINKFEGYLQRLAKTITAKFAHKIIAISQAVLSDCQIRYNIPKTKLILIYNGIQIPTILPRKLKHDTIIIGSIGRLELQKNYALLIQAIKDIDCKCLIAGEGSERNNLETLIKTLGMGNKVQLVGQIKDSYQFLSQLDLFVLPSIYEGLGNVLLEAGLMQLPIIASDVDGIKEIITENLFRSNDLTDLRNKITANIQNLKPDIGLSNKIRTEFDIKVISEKYQKLYEDLISQ